MTSLAVILTRTATRTARAAYRPLPCLQRSLPALTVAAQRWITTTPVRPYHKADKHIIDYYRNLPLPENKCLVTYVWIDGTGVELRCKTKTLDFIPKTAKDCPRWQFDGSSTGQAQHGSNSDLYLVPGCLFPDPFRLGSHKLLMCSTYNVKKEPTGTNHRHGLKKYAELIKDKEIEIAFEQEYTMMDCDTDRPYAWPNHGFPGPQGPYYCGVGAGKVVGRDIEDAHYRACLYAGIAIEGTNAEVMPAQWEYQVGPIGPVEIGDQLWMSRFIMSRIGEDYGVVCSLDPKPMSGDWNGAGNHCNVSDLTTMDKENGMKAIAVYIERLSKKHAEHLRAYDPHDGRDNARRLTGAHETSSMTNFTSGVADRTSSVRIPRGVADRGFGHFEDRRPSSNCDPYEVVKIMLQTMYDLE